MIRDRTIEVTLDEILDAKPEGPDELQALGQKIGEYIMQSVGKAQAGSARSQQSQRRHLGMSELGHCREYIRASIAGDEKTFSEKVKWPAAVGTATGDYVEASVGLRSEVIRTQQTTDVKLPSGIVVMGHDDIEFGRRRLVDLKTKDGTDEVRTSPSGPDFKEKVQISGYLVGKVQKGEMDEDATGHLVYLDRSGRDPKAWVFSVTYREALGWLAAADERLTEVAHALAAGQSQGPLRDMPESWCFHTGCPFYLACWGDEEYNPTNKLDPMYDDALEMYDRGRELKKAAENLIRNAKSTLNPEPGNDDLLATGEGSNFRVKWTLKQMPNGYVSPTIDVRGI